MYPSTVLTYFSFALVAFVSLTNGVQVHQLEKRQIGNLLSGVDTTSSSTTSITSDTTTSSSITSSTDTSISSSSSSSSSSSITSDTSISSSSSSSSTPTSTPSTSESSTITSASITTVPRTTILVTVTTDGSTLVSSSTDFSTSALPTQSGSVSPDQSGSGTTSGPPNKGAIIGATVGVGVAIILAGLGFVAWKLWGKKRYQGDEDEILMAGSSAHGEKLTGTSNNPFKTTLEQHHAHSGTNF